MIKYLGAALIVTAAGATGFSMAFSVRHEERCLAQLAQALELMKCEIPGRLTPVGELFGRCETCASGVMRGVFRHCARRIEDQTAPDVTGVMESALDEYEEKLPSSCLVLLTELGEVLGAYEATEQVEALQALSGRAEAALTALREGKADRCRSYEVLGVCAGCALAILLL